MLSITGRTAILVKVKLGVVVPTLHPCTAETGKDDGAFEVALGYIGRLCLKF